MQKFMSNATLDRSAVRTNNAGSERAAYKFKGRKTYRNQLSIADYTFLIQVVFLQETICAHCLKGSAGAAKIHWTRAGPHNAVLPQAAGRYREKSQRRTAAISRSTSSVAGKNPSPSILNCRQRGDRLVGSI